MLEESGKVCAVFQGHSHQNDYKEIVGDSIVHPRRDDRRLGARTTAAYSVMTLQPEG